MHRLCTTLILSVILLQIPAVSASNNSAYSWLTSEHYEHRMQFIEDFSHDIIASNIVDCALQEWKKCIRAGEFWSDFWVRDISYASLMGLWKLYPIELKNTFVELVLQNGDKWYPAQDASADFGAFPYQTDSLVWVLGAFELGKYTRDEAFLEYVLQVALKMEQEWKQVLNYSDALIVGAPSFLDAWSLMPHWWNQDKSQLIKHKFLSTNVIWARFQQIVLYEGQREGLWTQDAWDFRYNNFQETVQSINDKIYLPEKGYYAYYQASDRYESLGNVLLEMYGYNHHPIHHPKTESGYYPALYPMYELNQENDWYSGRNQFIWVDMLASKVQNEQNRNVCNRYFDHINNYQDIKEMIDGSQMLGGARQLWGAMALWSYFSDRDSFKKSSETFVYNR